MIARLGDKLVKVSYLNLPKLPSAYQEVEYIESTGTQYIETGITGGVEIKCIFQFTTTEATGYWKIVGASGNVSDRPYGMEVNYPTNTRVTFLEGGYNRDAVAFTTNKILYEREFNIVEGQDTDTNEWIIFKSGTKGKLFYQEMIKNNLSIRKFVPCYRKSDNVIGLYDMANNQFYTNAGTGTFLKGDDINTVDTTFNFKVKEN